MMMMKSLWARQSNWISVWSRRDAMIDWSFVVHFWNDSVALFVRSKKIVDRLFFFLVENWGALFVMRVYKFKKKKKDIPQLLCEHLRPSGRTRRTRAMYRPHSVSRRIPVKPFAVFKMKWNEQITLRNIHNSISCQAQNFISFLTVLTYVRSE